MNQEIPPHRRSLELSDISHVKDFYQRVLLFDPSEVYNRIERFIKPNQRTQAINMEYIFPVRTDGLCACGCEGKLTGRRSRWATDECSSFAFRIRAIICGNTDVIGNILYSLYGWNCSVCGKNELEIASRGKTDYRTVIEIEHILPVKHGGGGCWLGNYNLKCYICHREKTNKDFGYKSNKNKTLKLF